MTQTTNFSLTSLVAAILLLAMPQGVKAEPLVYTLKNFSAYNTNVFRHDGTLIGKMDRGLDKLTVKKTDFPITAALEGPCPTLQDSNCKEWAKAELREPGCYTSFGSPPFGGWDFLKDYNCKIKGQKLPASKNTNPPAPKSMNAPVSKGMKAPAQKH